MKLMLHLERSLKQIMESDLYVIEQYRNLGAAKLLLEAAKSYAVQTKAKGIGLSTAINNDKAQNLYENNGYKRDTEFYHYFLYTGKN